MPLYPLLPGLPAVGRRSHNVGLALLAMALLGCKSSRIAPPSHQLVIEKATWRAADGRASLDVTKILAGLVKNDGLSIAATTGILGDPAPFMLKELRLEWSRSGVVGRKLVPEGGTLTIGADEKPVPVRLLVRKAVYGNITAGQIVDVTQKVDGLLSDNVLSFVPTDDLFGDPAVGQLKEVDIDYTFDGVPKSRTGRQNELLTISPAAP
ncbi:MAG: hypothetical protein ABSB49_22335 [Polyangia bacterium]